MSENRDKGKGVADEEGKKLEDMKAQQDAEIERTKDVYKEGISSSSTPLTKIATDTKSGGSTTGPGKEVLEEGEKIKDSDFVSTEGNLSSSIPSMEWKMTEKMLKKPSGEITQFKSGESSSPKRTGKEILQDTAPIDERVSGFKRKIFLFEKHLTASDVEQDMLSIPVELALDRFPPLPETRLISYEEEIEVIDAQDHVLCMTITYDPVASAFLINSQWTGFAKCHGLRAMDRVRFYIPMPRLKENRYLIEYVRAEEFRGENVLFQKVLTRYEAKYSERLTLPQLEGRNPFPGYGIDLFERLCFTDAVNKDWWFTFQFQDGTYSVISGWEEFSNEYKVEEGDVIRFYKAVWPQSSQHFLIQHVKRDEAAGTRAKNEGCIPKISAMKKHGRGGGRGRKGKGKGKKFGGGDCCLA
ncbi:B3 domain-containing transcription factor [Actinidia chinensis var. chinensis]|uniref:B3 domain-containing transcription factor n=1 Tax=Actinidia chinensis var. chinensis TaxID=1590841 RepID=A0A2R6QJQ8_ACTCC|nr:B3 domain-containing transcription factor [Actinidia chinensis var. chinensis]